MILMVHSGVPRPIDYSRKERVECLLSVIVVGTSESSLVSLEPDPELADDGRDRHNEHQDANGKPERWQGTVSGTQMDSHIDLYWEQWDVEAHATVLH
jgi:hypothetical protein